MWVLDHLDDVESDMSAIHRVDDIYELSGPRFFKFATRLPAYRGVMRARLEVLAAERRAENGPQSNGDGRTPAWAHPSWDEPEDEGPAVRGLMAFHRGFKGHDGFPPVFGPKP